ncbi:IS3 family transposase [Flavobacterium sp. K5-23]|uniref:IS3 family transposase n=2 Tax=Flavobacterium sp. K5-23 TaxID=2746225 RepID=UPI00200E1CA0|nr:IS3 family transposase [Flavobacterium sp. K5-23]
MSKQAVNQYSKRQVAFERKIECLILEAEELRKEHPGCGVEKMYYALRPNFIGRDRFIDTFMDLGFRIKRHKNYRRTTFSVKVYFPNLIKSMSVYAPSTIWQSDITYIYVGERFYYAVFIIDVYTKKIVGHQLSNHMRATANLSAMQMALENNQAPMIHHSDRGSQYIYNEYIALLKVSGCEISMALSGQDNAYAERINRTIKEEYIDHWKPKTFEQLKKDVDRAVEHYNNKRPHNNIGKLSPVDFENNWFNNPLFSKPIITIFDNDKLIEIGQL